MALSSLIQEDYRKTLTGYGLRTTSLEGWDKARQRPDVLRLLEEEGALGPLPDWAKEIVDRMLKAPLPTCGHYLFPQPVSDVLRAIAAQQCPDFVVGCYTASPERKGILGRYVFCFDAWAKRAALADAKAEILHREARDRDWGAVIEAVYGELGEHTELKVLLVERLCHRLRWWMKTLMWKDDHRTQFCLDQYLGDVRGEHSGWGDYAQTSLRDPFMAELRAPHVVALEQRILALDQSAKQLIGWIHNSQLCGPKFFRWVERVIIGIGCAGSSNAPDFGRRVLLCEDLMPDLASYGRCFTSLLHDMGAWLQDSRTGVVYLGEHTPVKKWLVQLLVLRLNDYAETDNLGKLVGVRSAAHSPSAK